jgi:hypothetical protein
MLVEELLCMLQRAGKWEVRHYYLVYPAPQRACSDYGICFHSRFHEFTYIRQHLHILLPEHFHFHSLTDSSQGKRVMMPGFGRLQQTDEPAAFHLLQLID